MLAATFAVCVPGRAAVRASPLLWLARTAADSAPSQGSAPPLVSHPPFPSPALLPTLLSFPHVSPLSHTRRPGLLPGSEPSVPAALGCGIHLQHHLRPAAAGGGCLLARLLGLKVWPTATERATQTLAGEGSLARCRRAAGTRDGSRGGHAAVEGSLVLETSIPSFLWMPVEHLCRGPSAHDPCYPLPGSAAPEGLPLPRAAQAG